MTKEELWKDFRNNQNITWKHIDYFRLDTDIYEINNKTNCLNNYIL